MTEKGGASDGPARAGTEQPVSEQPARRPSMVFLLFGSEDVALAVESSNSTDPVERHFDNLVYGAQALEDMRVGHGPEAMLVAASGVATALGVKKEALLDKWGTLWGE